MAMTHGLTRALVVVLAALAVVRGATDGRPRPNLRSHLAHDALLRKALDLESHVAHAQSHTAAPASHHAHTTLKLRVGREGVSRMLLGQDKANHHAMANHHGTKGHHGQGSRHGLEEFVGQALPERAVDGAHILPDSIGFDDGSPPNPEADSLDVSTIHDATLSVLTTNHGDLDFDQASRIYRLTVPGEVDVVTIVAAPHCPNAHVVIGGAPLPPSGDTPGGVAVGLGRVMNGVDVVVTAHDDETTRTYRVVVEREIGLVLMTEDDALDNPDDHPASCLSALTTTSCDLEFDASTERWTGTVHWNEDDTAAIIAHPTSSGATTQLQRPGEDLVDLEHDSSDEFPLNTGDNDMEVVVTAPDEGSKKTYFVTVVKEAAPDTPRSVCGECGKGRCDEDQRRCVCPKGFAGRDCSLHVGDTAWVLPPKAVPLDPSTQHTHSDPKALFRELRVKPCVKAMQSWSDVDSLPPVCSSLNSYCRTVMGALVRDLGDVEGHCTTTLHRCFSQPSHTLEGEGEGNDNGAEAMDLRQRQHAFGDCVFAVASPRSSAGWLVALDAAPGAVVKYAEPNHRFFVEVDSQATKVVLKVFGEVGATATLNGLPVDPASHSAPPMHLLPGPNKGEIVVTAQNHVTTSTYSVVVHRQLESNEPPSKNDQPKNAKAKANNDGASGEGEGEGEGEGREGGTVAGLTGLHALHTTLSPPFSPGCHLYHAEVDHFYESVALIPEIDSAAHPDMAGAYIAVHGTAVPAGHVSSMVGLLVGPNRIVVEVTSHDTLSTAVYTVIVTRGLGASLPSRNSELSALSLRPTAQLLAPSFTRGLHSYHATVPHDTPVVHLRAVLSDVDATMTIDGSAVESGVTSDPIPVWYGPNRIVVRVVAPDRTHTTEYVVAITRAFPVVPGKPSANALLDGIFFDGSLALEEPFDPELFEYTLRVPSGQEWGVLLYRGSDNQRVVVDGTSIPPMTPSRPIHLGALPSRRVVVRVQSQDTKHRSQYVIFVVGDDEAVTALRTLQLSSGALSPPFQRDTRQYTAVVGPSTHALTVTARPVDPSARVLFDGAVVPPGTPTSRVDLIPNGPTVVEVVVSLPNSGNDPTTYTITITRREPKFAATEYSKYHERFGAVPAEVDAANHCRLDRCHAQLREMLQLWHIGSVRMPGEQTDALDSLPPACATAAGQSRGADGMVWQGSEAWQAHFQCPVSAGCVSVADCSALVAECREVPSVLGLSVIDELRDWYDALRNDFVRMGGGGDSVTQQQLVDGLQNYGDQSAEEARQATAQLVYQREGDHNTLSFVAYFHAVMLRALPIAHPLHSPSYHRMRQLYGQFGQWECDSAHHTACPQSISDGLVAMGYDKAFADYAADKADVKGDGAVSFHDGFLRAVFDYSLPLHPCLDVSQDTNPRILRSVVEVFGVHDEDHSAALSLAEFSALVTAQHRAHDATPFDVEALFKACAKGTTLPFGAFASCAAVGLVPLDAVDTANHLDYRQLLDQFTVANASGSGLMTTPQLATHIAQVRVLQPAGDAERSFATFLAAQIDTNANGDISQDEYLGAVATGLLVPDAAEYAWLRLFEIWSLYRTVPADQLDELGTDRMIDLLSRVSLMRPSDAFFLANALTNDEGTVPFARMVDVLTVGVSTMLSQKYLPANDNADVTKFLLSVDADGDGYATDVDVSQGLIDLGWHPDAAHALAVRVATAAQSYPRGGVRGDGAVAVGAILQSVVDGLLVIQEVRKESTPHAVLSKVLAQTAEWGESAPVRDVREALLALLKPAGLDESLVDDLVMASESVGMVSTSDLVTLLMSGLHVRWGRLGDINPSCVPFAVLRSLVRTYRDVAVHDADSAMSVAEFEGFLRSVGMSDADVSEVVAVANPNGDSALTVAEFVAAWRLGLVPRSPTDAVAVSTLLHTVLGMYTQLLQNGGEGIVVNAMMRHVRGTQPLLSPSQQEGVVWMAVGEVDQDHVAKRRFVVAALSGVVDAAVPSALSLHAMCEGIKEGFLADSAGNALTMSRDTLLHTVMHQDFSPTQAELVVAATTEQDTTTPLVTVWQFARAVLRGSLPLHRITASIDDQHESALADRALGPKSDTELALDEFAGMGDGDLPTHAVQSRLTDVYGLQEGQAQLVARALDPEATGHVTLEAAMRAKHAGVFDLGQHRMGEVLQLALDIAQSHEGSVPTSSLHAFLRHEGLTPTQATVLTAAIAHSQDTVAVEQVVAACVEGLLPVAVPPKHLVALAVLADAWASANSQLEASPGVCSSRDLENAVISRGLEPQHAIHLVQAITQGAAQGTFQAFTSTLLPSVLPVVWEWKEARRLYPNTARVLLHPSVLSRANRGGDVDRDTAAWMLRLSGLPTPAVSLLLSAYAPTSFPQLLDRILEGTFVLHPHTAASELRASKPMLPPSSLEMEIGAADAAVATRTRAGWVEAEARLKRRRSHTASLNTALKPQVLLELEATATSNGLLPTLPFDHWADAEHEDREGILQACSSTLAGAPGVCREQLETRFGFSPLESETLVHGTPDQAAGALVACLYNQQGWECKMLLRAFATFHAVPSVALPVASLSHALSSPSTHPLDTLAIARACDVNADGEVSFAEWVAAVARGSMPVHSESGATASVLEVVRHAREQFRQPSCSNGNPSITLHTAVHACQSRLHHPNDPSPTQDQLEALQMLCKHRAHNADEITEDAFVELALQGLVAVAPEVEADGNAASGVVAGLERRWESGRSREKEGAERVVQAMGLGEGAAKAVVSFMLSTTPKATYPTFPSFLRAFLTQLLPASQTALFHAGSFDYVQAATDSRGATNVAPLQSFVHCYFNRRKATTKDRFAEEYARQADLVVTDELPPFVSAKEGEALTLQWRVTGATEFHWTLGNGKEVVTPEGTLTKVASMEDAGQVHCMATNGISAIESPPTKLVVSTAKGD